VIKGGTSTVLELVIEHRSQVCRHLVTPVPGSWWG
jgi:hypothetical protein